MYYATNPSASQSSPWKVKELGNYSSLAMNGKIRPMSKERILSGIQPTGGSFHLGNYLGALSAVNLPFRVKLHTQ